MTATGVASAADGGLGLDWDQPEPPSPWNAPPAAVPGSAPAEAPATVAVASVSVADEPEPVVDESEATGELP